MHCTNGSIAENVMTDAWCRVAANDGPSEVDGVSIPAVPDRTALMVVLIVSAPL